MLSGDIKEFFHLRGDHTSVRPTGDTDRTTATHLNDPFVAKDTQSAQHGVGVDTEFGGQIFRLRYSFSGTGFAVSDGATNGSGHLFVKERRVASIKRMEGQRVFWRVADAGLERTHENNYSSFNDYRH